MILFPDGNGPQTLDWVGQEVRIQMLHSNQEIVGWLRFAQLPNCIGVSTNPDSAIGIIWCHAMAAMELFPDTIQGAKESVF